jgi:Putative Ig domain
MIAASGSLQAQAPLTITTASLPTATIGTNYQTAVGVTGGALPYTWQVSSGALPPGLKLDAKKGVIAGTATTAGTYHFEVLVTDSGVPAMQIQREYTLVVTAALTIEWRKRPAVHGQTIDGSVIVSNLTERDFTLTVIVVAVNQIGRATTLGYQKFTLGSGGEQVIPFGSSPGPGSYIVHADAVAEVASTNTIYRARKQTAQALVIQAPD